jgi:hypothetical protein
MPMPHTSAAAETSPPRGHELERAASPTAGTGWHGDAQIQDLGASRLGDDVAGLQIKVKQPIGTQVVHRRAELLAQHDGVGHGQATTGSVQPIEQVRKCLAAKRLQDDHGDAPLRILGDLVGAHEVRVCEALE